MERTLGQRIRYLRNRNSMTQEELAGTLYVSRETVSKWEQDKNEPCIETLIKLSELFGVSLDFLIKGTTF